MARAPVEEPDGLLYRPELLSADEERDVVAQVEALDFTPIVMRGQAAKRTVRHFGLRYDYEAWTVEPTDPLPDELGWLRDRCASLADVDPELLGEILVTRYPEGAGIGWHRDAPMFGRVIGVSLLSECRMRFQRGKGEARRVFDLWLEPRSAYVLAGPSRTAWQHSIPGTEALRYSITFREYRSRRR